MAKHDSIPPPKGTRDLYPEDLLRQRYITEAWRRVSIRHGFDEIAGPTFEMLDLYKKKSGEGIVSELFSFRRSGGDDDYALRPEFTPTLARMYAAKASSLPSPCKWFTAGPYFRAEKPQRGRLREFLQWNCDVMGGDERRSDADILVVLYDLLKLLGVNETTVPCKLNERRLASEMLVLSGANHADIERGLWLLDQRSKISSDELDRRMSQIGIDVRRLDAIVQLLSVAYDEGISESIVRLKNRKVQPTLAEMAKYMQQQGRSILTSDDVSRMADISTNYTESIKSKSFDLSSLQQLDAHLDQSGISDWSTVDASVARGLAYYTGTVFELIADGERAVAGGGRYDNLIELFGGPPTPAVGFGMGDVVLGLLLEDKGLMPEGPALMDALSQKPASLRPEAFVIASEQGEPHVEPLLAQLRRGVESDAWKQRSGKPWDADRYAPDSGGVAPMHARRSYKSTKNIGKLLAEARKHHARFAVIIESDHAAKIENLESKQDLGVFTLDPASPDSIARALAREMGH